jgi:hypothetical protein
MVCPSARPTGRGVTRIRTRRIAIAAASRKRRRAATLQILTHLGRNWPTRARLDQLASSEATTRHSVIAARSNRSEPSFWDPHRSSNRASASARSDGGRCCQAWKPERETPSMRHMSEIEWFAFSAAMKRKTLTGSRSGAFHVDAYVHVLPADGEAANAGAVSNPAKVVGTSHSVSDESLPRPAVDPAELLDVDVHELARVAALVAVRGFRRLQARELAQPDPRKHRRDGGTKASRASRRSPPPSAAVVVAPRSPPHVPRKCDAAPSAAPRSDPQAPARPPHGNGAATSTDEAPTRIAAWLAVSRRQWEQRARRRDPTLVVSAKPSVTRGDAPSDALAS